MKNTMKLKLNTIDAREESIDSRQKRIKSEEKRIDSEQKRIKSGEKWIKSGQKRIDSAEKPMKKKAIRRKKLIKPVDQPAIWMHSGTTWVRTIHGLMLSGLEMKTTAAQFNHVKLKNK